MISICTRGCQYAIRAMIYLARVDQTTNARQSDVAQATDVPLPYLSKLLSALARSGLITTRRGPSGGVRLARPAEAILLDDVVRAVDGREVIDGCLLGYPNCTPDKPCSLHPSWLPIKLQILKQIQSKTLADLAFNRTLERDSSRTL